MKIVKALIKRSDPMFENEKTEFKSQRSETVYKDIIAFANTGEA